MANFDYNAGIDAELRNVALEGALEKMGADEAAKVAGLAGLTDAGADGDFDVADDADMVALTVAAKAWFKKTK